MCALNELSGIIHTHTRYDENGAMFSHANIMKIHVNLFQKFSLLVCASVFPIHIISERDVAKPHLNVSAPFEILIKF